MPDLARECATPRCPACHPANPRIGNADKDSAMHPRSSLLPFLSFAFLACGPAGGGGGTGTSVQGITACGDFGGSPKKCQPGQYCKDESLSMCENGCLSNVNCASDQYCDKSTGMTVGNCENSQQQSQPDGGGGAELAHCLAACDKAGACGYFTPGDVIQCKDGCDKVSDVVRKALADCVDNKGCNSQLPTCFDPNCGQGLTCCGPSYACPSGKTCVGHLCT
jgi:hypothetical protein